MSLPLTKFTDLGLSEPILQALEQTGYDTPTPIQEQAIPLVLKGKDLFGIAQTGTGKTAAFMLPSIDNLAKADKYPAQRSCRMLVLAPTRELAGQIAKNAAEYARYAHMKVAVAVGGTPVSRNRRELKGGVDILIATPGRLVDLEDQRIISLSKVEILVLDEADQMLDLGFIHALRSIVKMLPQERQTLFFSATLPKSIRSLAAQFLNNPAQVSVTPESTTAERVKQQVMRCNAGEKQAILTMMLRDGFAGTEMDRVLAFTRTKHGADRVVKKLAQAGIYANAIHGNKSQPQRERALEEFRQGKVKVLVATDIAARGIDIPGVSHVINFELPNVPEQYVHRIGRTARAGASGVAISFCAPDEKAYLRQIWKLTKADLEDLPLPEGVSAEASKINAAAKNAPADRRGPSGRGPGGGGGRGRPQRDDDGGSREARPPRRRKPSVNAKPRGGSYSGGGNGGGGGQGRGNGGGQRSGQGGGGNRRGRPSA